MWYSYSLSTTTYSFLIISFILHVQQSHALRCKCNANRGVSQCTGNFCDIHNRDGKRAACGALRHARQTIFACVLIRRTSNDTYCHVIGSTTACWCREMDFCNADLEAELFDVDESTDNSDELQSPPLSSSSSSSSSSLSSSLSSSSSSSSSLANSISNLQNEKITVESNLKQLARTRMNPIQSFDAIATTMKSVAESNDKQSMRRKINSAIEVDVAEKIKLTPQRENSSPTVIAEIISESGEYALDEK
ncbi:unnamed protein product [Litomosoides sigmodontis]|uniref:Activin types I and II receptor domain-containing protein n=1 Tax=Litomosoides sigmodontis TaxID=42156 RepID=A0A3P7K263_LITSI|nr:unnamed protein product [Litomosoides sigmodontis]